MSAPDETTATRIRRRAERMQRSRARPTWNPLHGLSAFGVIGWSVALPAVLGAVLGVWLDRALPQSFSWPLALILGGIVVGVIVAWEWIAREARHTAESEAPPSRDGSEAPPSREESEDE